MITAQLTPTQRDSIERSRAFQAKIAARAVPEKPAPEKPFAVKGQYVPAPVKAAPEVAMGLPPQAMPDRGYELPETVSSRIVQIQKAVAQRYRVRLIDMRSNCRRAPFVRPRHIAMYLCRVRTDHSTLEIGRRFGGRDHATVLHAFKKIDSALQRDVKLAGEIAELQSILDGGSQQ